MFNPRPTELEEKYVDYDDDTAMWCIFGLDSGHAYASYASEDDANKALDNQE